MSIKNRINNVYRYFEPNLIIIGYLGCIGFPLYFFVWHYLFPQPYENFLLRLFCGTLFIPFILKDHLPYWFLRYKAIHFIATITIGLPFFFSYMLIMNDWSIPWIMSFMAALFLSILLIYDAYIISAISIIGITMGAFFSYGFHPINSENFHWGYIAVISFSYVTGIASHYRNHIHYEDQLLFARSFSAGIAHEMRNPFSSLYSSMELMLDILRQKSDNKEGNVNELESIIRSNMTVINNSNETINLLLSSINEHAISKNTFQEYSIVNIIKSSVESFGYQSSKDRNLVSVEFNKDTNYFGSDILFRYVIFNIMKNAFYYKEKSNFNININVDINTNNNVIKIRDTGIGIPKNNLDAIFDDFFTHGKKNSSGLGLPFCKKVITAFGGVISCQSKLGEWTEFTIILPKSDSKSVNKLKYELMSKKRLLYIGDNNSDVFELQKNSFSHGYNFNTVSPFKLIDIPFDQVDMIIINLDSYSEHDYYFSKLQDKLALLTTKVLYLHRTPKALNLILNEKINYKLVNASKIENDFTDHICRFFFIHFNNQKNTPRSTTDTKSILLVDDNMSLRMYTGILLQRSGFHVIHAENGVNALKNLELSQVDLIMMDLEMPLMGGLETTKQIRSNKRYESHKNTPIICFSASLDEKQQQDLSKVGMNGFIFKPATKEQIFSSIERFIN
ncbi:hybrid sensor histidine kinase/response regulator [Photobacterium angustum]|uniref:hybrid sensor histidine kinase/response regulator n=1 Tax=Photobacterium angustum TaxID=661 RepID=UPI0005DAA494|nr:hybrid sensor histidine kinase/response regulator [Photobacterium angustum]KJG24491.1 chemotaxis protein CheY [Photobacterium angustum]KJG32821.1 chemotaxis protein CheY [Photobacterium angustum]PSW97439.1 hybrid sensor histidine kinase/response regulator [Photobacterium angustum]PSX00423.1 hybrid sensor histidine kinase/response regulator [Photobacterium angustum]PSX36613.1 hybrid sensor histidine kinase/response regulator [Photobacterium angustum]